MNRMGLGTWEFSQVSFAIYSVPLGKLLHRSEPQFPVFVVGSM